MTAYVLTHRITVVPTPEEVILPELDRKLGLYAQRKLAARAIEIIPQARVTAAVEGAVALSNGQETPSNAHMGRWYRAESATEHTVAAQAQRTHRSE